mgnify:CR=1 FL=1
MSWRATAWVKDHPKIVTQMQFAVMCNLADWANERNEWAPSHAAWAKASRCSVSSLKRTILEMEDAGLVTVVPRKRNQPNVYRLNMPTTPDLPLHRDTEQDRALHERALESRARRRMPRLPIGHPDAVVAHGDLLPEDQSSAEAVGHGEPLVGHGELLAVGHGDPLVGHSCEPLVGHQMSYEQSVQPSTTARPDFRLTPEQIELNRRGMAAIMSRWAKPEISPSEAPDLIELGD